MKKLVLLFTLITSLVYGQFNVTDNSNEWKKVGSYLSAITLYQRTDSTKAKIRYLDFAAVIQRNMFSPTVDYEFEFSTDSKTLDDLYQMIEDKLKQKKIETVTLEFPEGKMYLNFDYSTFGGYYFYFQFDNNSGGIDKNSTRSKRNTYGLSLDRVKKLFNKKGKSK